MHPVRFGAALSLAGMTAALAWFNVTGWLADGLLILAILAAFFEAIGFLFACLVEDAARARRFDRALVAGAILIGAAAFNTVGGHRAWEAAMAPRRDAQRQAAQAELDRERAALQTAAAEAAREVAAVPLAAPGERSVRQAEARQTWELATADARARRARAEARLEALPIVAPPPPPMIPDALAWAFLAFLELAKALGLWAVGVMAAARLTTEAPARGNLSSPSDNFNASEAARRLVAMRRDRRPLAA